MKENKKNRKTLRFGVILIIMSIVGIGLQISFNVKAMKLEKKCIKETTGMVCETGIIVNSKSHPDIDYFVAEYEVNDVPYKTKGMGNAVKGTVVTVWYDPELPFNSYAGDSPIKYSMVTVISYLIACIAVMAIGIAAVEQYIRDRN